MADSALTQAPSRDYVLRRWHSLTGIVPVGAFLFVHLATNFMFVVNTETLDLYQQQIDRIHLLGPLLLPVEIMFIFAPLLFHAALGIKIWTEGKNNTRHYGYVNNYRYMIQRISGGIVLVFVIVHVWQMHWLGKPLGGGMFDPHDASATASYAIQSTKAWSIPLYAIGILAACYHLANGIWTAMISWGISIGALAQRKMTTICTAIGLALAIIGIWVLVGLAMYPEAHPKSETAVVESEQI